ncbi:FUSC family protein [Corynebacterium lubricantis]|uniref:FUSC family protein n=1 Tax=Corynebacterium lubricantis TaxID=541095 RepID=UPI000476A0C1|nr:FUSC family protein [Corynebacterium lubricantis]
MAKERMGTRARLHAVDRSLHSRIARLRKRWWQILQTALAAGVAYWVAQELIGHTTPFFAPIAVVIILSVSGGDRVKRAFELSMGCVLGVLVGDLLIAPLGAGGWQISLAVGVSLAVAGFFSPSVLVNNQVAIGSILIATIMPPGSANTGIDRTLDAVVGSVIAILVIAFLPSSPLSSARHEIAKVLGIASSVLDDVAKGLRDKDAELIDDALAAIRGTQSGIDAMLVATKTGAESSKISPFLWATRRYVRSLERIIEPVDNSIRNVRVLARRAHVLVQDGDTVSDRQIEIIDALAKYFLDLSDVYEVKTELRQSQEIPILVNKLRQLGSEASMDVIEEDGVLSAYVILAQSRSTIVDLLQVCGMSRESALAMLTPTSETPAYPPETWDKNDHDSF